MHSLQWYDYIRLATSTVALIGLYRMMNLVRKRHTGYSARMKDVVWLAAGSLFIFCVGSLESIATNVPFGWRVPLTFMVVLVGIRATRYSDEPLQKL